MSHGQDESEEGLDYVERCVNVIRVLTRHGGPEIRKKKALYEREAGLPRE